MLTHRPSLPVRLSCAGLAACLVLFGRPAQAQKPLSSAGVTEPFLSVTTSAAVAGNITRRLVKEGDFVKAGQILLELEKRQEELEVQRRKLVMDSKAELNGAKARVETLKADAESTRKLFEATKSVSKDDVAKKELEYKMAAAEVDRLEMTEAREIIEHDMAKETLRERTLISPLDGYVVELFREAGESCKAQDPLIRLVDTRQFYFVSNVEAKTAYHLKVGQPLRVDVEAGKTTTTFTGKISFVSPVVDPASGLMKVKVLCQNPDGKVRPGVAGTMYFNPE